MSTQELYDCIERHKIRNCFLTDTGEYQKVCELCCDNIGESMGAGEKLPESFKSRAYHTTSARIAEGREKYLLRTQSDEYLKQLADQALADKEARQADPHRIHSKAWYAKNHKGVKTQ